MTTPAAGPHASLFAHGLAAASLGAIALVSLMAFEAMAVAAAMPAIATALAGLRLYALAFGGMLATSVFGMVLAGRSCDRDGPLRAAAVGLLVFAAGLVIAGLAPGMGWLVAGRIVQGLGSGMLGVALYAGMGQVVPAALHPRLFAMMAAAWVLPALVGPAVAAWLVHHWGWRAVFLVAAALTPFAAALLLPAFRRLGRPRHDPQADTPPPARLRWAALGAIGALLLHAASDTASAGPLIATVVAGLLASLLAATRLLPAGSLAAAPGLPAVIAQRALLASAFFSAEAFVPLYLTRQQGWSLGEAGLLLSAGAVMWSAGSAVQARLRSDRHRRHGLRAGLLAVALGVALVCLPAALDWTVWTVLPGWALAGFGIGLGFPMLSVLTLALSAPAEQGRNASALQLSDALGSSALLAVSGALFNLVGSGGPRGHALVFGLAAAVALVGAMVSARPFASVPAGA
jgi:MFS family permease